MAIEPKLHNPTALDTREMHGLIGSDKVQGTAVYRSNGEKVGNIARVMIGKQSGKVGYAVMSFGGFLGICSSTQAPKPPRPITQKLQ
jgi:hypothetical protein